MNDVTLCPMCGHENDEPMGQLGGLTWTRCRACGMVYSSEEK